MAVYKGRLYVQNGEVRGQGGLLEAQYPAGGNNNFQWVTPPDMQVFEVAVFNGFLYLGLTDLSRGYAVVKTDAAGTPPYTFTPVVTDGAFRTPYPSRSVVSMHVFNDRLYVGTDKPTEVIRINPDDTWDLLVGDPRQTPEGWKYPLSGLGSGFDWPVTWHIWRMQQHDGVLYVGTYDESRRAGNIGGLGRWLSWGYAFDLYRTSDGFYFTAITTNGFGDQFQSGIRTFASTPHGLFFGTSGVWYGLRIWRGTPGTPPIEPPQRLEVEGWNDMMVLSWEPLAGASRVRVFRSDFGPAGVPAPFNDIGTTTNVFFVDTTVQPNQRYQYHVVAEDAGTLSSPSNKVLAPSLAPAVTLTNLEDTLSSWTKSPILRLELRLARALVQAGNLEGALRQLEHIRLSLSRNPTSLAPWRAEDLTILLAKLERRVRLAQIGLIPPSELI